MVASVHRSSDGTALLAGVFAFALALTLPHACYGEGRLYGFTATRGAGIAVSNFTFSKDSTSVLVRARCAHTHAHTLPTRAIRL